MEVKKGRNRIILIFPSTGIVIKFAFIHFVEAFRCLFRDIKRRDWKYLKRKLKMPLGRGISGFKDYLLLGIAHNWLEFWFYIKTRNVFLQPTYFSLFGFFNIQKMGKVCEFSATDLWCQLYELTEEKVWKHCHHFSNPANFCFDGKLRIFDYGDKRTQEVIVEYGEKISKEFNPNFNWEVEKHKRNIELKQI